MKNIFIMYIPPGNFEAQVHYEDTIKKKVERERIFRHVDKNLQDTLNRIFGNRLVTVWGSRDSDANRQKFERMQTGDDILIIEGDTIKLLGKIAAKTINRDLSQELWKNLKGRTTEGWDLIYFIANPLEIELPFIEFKKLFNYEPNWALRGFTSIAQNKLEEFYSKYDDLYSVLQRLRKGEKIEEKKTSTEETEKAEEAEEAAEPDDKTTDEKELSNHLMIQWKLIRLGLKTGSKVWIPKSDQSRITAKYNFGDFESEFTAGLDVSAKYVENIDVVWKEEFRIDAAFEVENTTAIYSGLLRFSDLKIVAPNSTYPLFVVAPLSRRNRLIQQINRPTFRNLKFAKDVRYLPYETVEEIDRFFEYSSSGLNVDLLVGKSQAVDQ